MSELGLVEQAHGDRGSEQIIGGSAGLQSVLSEVERVAPTDASVLVLGETGTGKELIARAIHDLSPRRDRPFVKLDCAAIPFDRLESELFGHEIGAFPWASAQKIGRFEAADTGTLFLDEIGDLPLAFQPHLLRILREQGFERPGSGRTHRVNVRLVAATNRDLTDMIRQGQFRSDLYYRMNGFPITLPPLRERGHDIPLLVSHFVKTYSQRLGKRIHHIPEATLGALISHSWPGNVRELQNLIKRAVILSNDGVLPNPLRMSDRISMMQAPREIRPNLSLQSAVCSHRGEASDAFPVPDKHARTATPGAGHEPANADPSAELPIVFVIDEDVVMRESMMLLVHQQGWQAENFSCAQEFLARQRPLVPNCLVLDVSLKDLNCLELQKRIAIERSETPIVFIADQGDVSTSVQAMKAGAVEFLIKPLNEEAFVGAVREGLKRSSVALGREAGMRMLRNCYASLSHREKQVMALVVTGLLNKQVGAELGISESTVKGHRGRVMQKMEANSVPDLVRMAARLRSERAFLAFGQHRSPLSSQPAPQSDCRLTVPPPSPGVSLSVANRKP